MFYIDNIKMVSLFLSISLIVLRFPVVFFHLLLIRIEYSHLRLDTGRDLAHQKYELYVSDATGLLWFLLRMHGRILSAHVTAGLIEIDWLTWVPQSKPIDQTAERYKSPTRTDSLYESFNSSSSLLHKLRLPVLRHDWRQEDLKYIMMHSTCKARIWAAILSSESSIACVWIFTELFIRRVWYRMPLSALRLPLYLFVIHENCITTLIHDRPFVRSSACILKRWRCIAI